eukprot:scaffold3870_cov246-Pinguiococcus_pyrenoidosus.AAC.18
MLGQVGRVVEGPAVPDAEGAEVVAVRAAVRPPVSPWRSAAQREGRVRPQFGNASAAAFAILLAALPTCGPKRPPPASEVGDGRVRQEVRSGLAGRPVPSAEPFPSNARRLVHLAFP